MAVSIWVGRRRISKAATDAPLAEVLAKSGDSGATIGIAAFPPPQAGGASFRLDPRFTVGVGYEHVDSSLDAYDDAGVTFSVGFTGWSR